MRRLPVWSVGVVFVLASTATSCSRSANHDGKSVTTITTEDSSEFAPALPLGALTATLSLDEPLADDDASLLEDLLREGLSTRFDDVAIKAAGDTVTVVITGTTEAEAAAGIGDEGPVESSAGTESTFPVKIVNILFDFTPDPDRPASRRALTTADMPVEVRRSSGAVPAHHERAWHRIIPDTEASVTGCVGRRATSVTWPTPRRRQ